MLPGPRRYSPLPAHTPPAPSTPHMPRFSPHFSLLTSHFSLLEKTILVNQRLLVARKKGMRVGFRHVVAVDQFSRNDLEQIFTHAHEMRTFPRDERRLSGRILATIF